MSFMHIRAHVANKLSSLFYPNGEQMKYKFCFRLHTALD
jgi:hypothetical protein